MNHLCHHYGLQGHTRPNCHKLRSLRNASDQRLRGPRNDKRTWVVESSRDRNSDLGMMDVMKMIGALTNCLVSFTRRFESPNFRTQSYRDITPNARDVWVKKGTHAQVLQHVHALILPMLCDYVWLCVCWLFELSTGWLFVCFCIKCFYTVVLDQSFPSCVSKIQKPYKKQKIQKV